MMVMMIMTRMILVVVTILLPKTKKTGGTAAKVSMNSCLVSTSAGVKAKGCSCCLIP